MASLFGHAFVAAAISTNCSKKIISWKLFLLGVLCAILPDIDVISFRLGIPYGSFWGHRGFTHSLLFAIILGLSVSFVFYRQTIFSLKGLGYFFFFTLCAASHSILDAMTNGGLGVAFFSPWNETRYFLPWRPINVSPIGVGKFFTGRGLSIIKNEVVWIGVPCIIYMVLTRSINYVWNIFSRPVSDKLPYLDLD